MKPLTYGAVKANASVVDGITASGLDPVQRTEASISFLKLSDPDMDFDAMSPGEIYKAAKDLYMVTFSPPEGGAPAALASDSTGANSPA